MADQRPVFDRDRLRSRVRELGSLLDAERPDPAPIRRAIDAVSAEIHLAMPASVPAATILPRPGAIETRAGSLPAARPAAGARPGLGTVPPPEVVGGMNPVRHALGPAPDPARRRELERLRAAARLAETMADIQRGDWASETEKGRLLKSLQPALGALVEPAPASR